MPYVAQQPVRIFGSATSFVDRSLPAQQYSRSKQSSMTDARNKALGDALLPGDAGAGTALDMADGGTCV